MCQRSWGGACTAKEKLTPRPLVSSNLEYHLLSQLPGRVTQSFSRCQGTPATLCLASVIQDRFSKCHRVLEGFQTSVTEHGGVYGLPSLCVVTLAARSRGQPRAHGMAESLSLLWLETDLSPSQKHPTSTGRAQLAQQQDPLLAPRRGCWRVPCQQDQMLGANVAINTDHP